MEPVSLRKLSDDRSAQIQHLIERIEAELAFAGMLGELQPDRAGGWKPLLKQARERAAAGVGDGRLEAVEAAVAEAERILAPVAEVAKTYNVHLVGHAHIDMNWMWSWPETVAVTIDTFSTVLRLMEDYPQFHFSQSQASTYAIIEKHRPDLLKKIARRVKEGRWEVIASHWVEGDKNLAGGEALTRHLLYTRRYIQQLFGLKPDQIPIDWSPDTFGHAATIPTYLAQGGVKYLYLHRPGLQTPAKPGAFWWEGPDGARVLVRNDMVLGYNGVIQPALTEHLFNFCRLTGGRQYLFVYGVGDHGGGPTRRDILRGLDMATWPVFPTIRFSTAVGFYRALEAEAAKLPVIKGELNCEFTGCYTTQTLIKKSNRFAEARLVDAELASVLAGRLARVGYPQPALEKAWRDTLFSHFHDILPGSGVHDTRTYTHGLYQETIATTAAIETHALRQIAGRIDTSAAKPADTPELPASHIADATGAGVGFKSADGNFWQSDQSSGHGPRPFVLFNPTSAAYAGVVDAVVWDNAPAGRVPLKNRTFTARRPDGTEVPAQATDGGGFWGHDWVSLAFPAEVPGFGYAQYTIVEDPAETGPRLRGFAGPPPIPHGPGAAWQVGWTHHCSYAFIEQSAEGLENEFVRVVIDPVGGGIRQLIEKTAGRTLVNAPGATALEYAVERPHPMNAWSIDHTGPVESPQLVSLQRTLRGPYRAAIEATVQMHESRFTVAYELRAGDPRLYVTVKGVWFQRGTPETGVPVLRFALPLALADARASYEIPFGAIDRPATDETEVPALRWAEVTGTADGQPAGCLLLNDSKHGHSLAGNTLRLTLIRSAYEPDILPEIGQHEVRLAVQPLAGAMPAPEAIHAAQQFNHPIRIVSTGLHAGDLPASGQWIQVSPSTVCVSGIKKAEDSRAMVLRLFNPGPAKVTAKLQFNAEALGPVTGAQEVDLLERPVAKSTATIDGNTVRVAIPAHGMATVMVKLKS